MFYPSSNIGAQNLSESNIDCLTGTVLSVGITKL